MDEFSAEVEVCGGWAGEVGDCEYDGDAVKAITATETKPSLRLMNIAIPNCTLRLSMSSHESEPREVRSSLCYAHSSPSCARWRFRFLNYKLQYGDCAGVEIQAGF